MESFDQHISHQFNQELENLRQKMMAMGGMVEEMLKNAVQAVVTGDTELAVRSSRPMTRSTGSKSASTRNAT